MAMRMLLAILLLMGCGSKDQETDVGAGSEGQSGGVTGAEARPAAEDPALLGERVRSAMSAMLRDAKAARYANLRGGAEGTICGEIDAKRSNGKYAGMRPFVVMPDGAAFISMSARVNFGDPSDDFPDRYITYCASPDELRTLGPRIAAEGSGVPAPPIDEIPALPEDIGVDAEPGSTLLPPHQRYPSGAGTTPSAPGKGTRGPGARSGGESDGDDSFFNAVVRPPDEAPQKR